MNIFFYKTDGSYINIENFQDIIINTQTTTQEIQQLQSIQSQLQLYLTSEQKQELKMIITKLLIISNFTLIQKQLIQLLQQISLLQDKSEQPNLYTVIFISLKLISLENPTLLQQKVLEQLIKSFQFLISQNNILLGEQLYFFNKIIISMLLIILNLTLLQNLSLERQQIISLLQLNLLQQNSLSQNLLNSLPLLLNLLSIQNPTFLQNQIISYLEQIILQQLISNNSYSIQNKLILISLLNNSINYIPIQYQDITKIFNLNVPLIQNQTLQILQQQFIIQIQLLLNQNPSTTQINLIYLIQDIIQQFNYNSIQPILTLQLITQIILLLFKCPPTTKQIIMLQGLQKLLNLQSQISNNQYISLPFQLEQISDSIQEQLIAQIKQLSDNPTEKILNTIYITLQPLNTKSVKIIQIQLLFLLSQFVLLINPIEIIIPIELLNLSDIMQNKLILLIQSLIEQIILIKNKQFNIKVQKQLNYLINASLQLLLILPNKEQRQSTTEILNLINSIITNINLLTLNNLSDTDYKTFILQLQQYII